jgi:hypothetical protein
MYRLPFVKAATNKPSPTQPVDFFVQGSGLAVLLLQSINVSRRMPKVNIGQERSRGNSDSSSSVLCFGAASRK